MVFFFILIKRAFQSYLAVFAACSMSVSHPNCITTYKLSVIRLLRGEDLLEEQSSSESLPPTGCLSNNSGRTDDSAMASGANKGGRRVRSLLSGAEAVEVEDPYGQLQPGLYETWIVSEASRELCCMGGAM